MARIVVTRPIAENGLVKLREARHDVIVHDDWVMNEEQLKEFVQGADILICLLTDQVTAAVMDAAGPQLRHIASYNVGFDNIDLEAAAARNISVTHTPGAISSTAVAEHALTLMLALARNLRTADTYMRSGQYQHWGPNLFTGQQLRGKTLGIVGSGQIGAIIAQICHTGFNMPVLYTDVIENHGLQIMTGAKKVELYELLEQSDVVSVHVPLLPSTRHMFGSEQFEHMKDTAILINTARGPIVDEVALVDALRQGKLYGAGLDVFEFEPYLAEGLAALDNVIVTPHIASATEVTRHEMSLAVAKNIAALLDGKPTPNLVK